MWACIPWAFPDGKWTSGGPCLTPAFLAFLDRCSGNKEYTLPSPACSLRMKTLGIEAGPLGRRVSLPRGPPPGFLPYRRVVGVGGRAHLVRV